MFHLKHNNILLPQQNPTQRRSNRITQGDENVVKGHLHRPIFDRSRVHDVGENPHNDHDPIAKGQRKDTLHNKRDFRIGLFEEDANYQADILYHFP